jgi:hypothetical protein
MWSKCHKTKESQKCTVLVHFSDEWMVQAIPQLQALAFDTVWLFQEQSAAVTLSPMHHHNNTQGETS